MPATQPVIVLHVLLGQVSRPFECTARTTWALDLGPSSSGHFAVPGSPQATEGAYVHAQGMMGTEGMYRGQEMLSYATQRSMVDAKIDEGVHAWMHHTGA